MDIKSEKTEVGFKTDLKNHNCKEMGTQLFGVCQTQVMFMHVLQNHTIPLL